MSALLFVIAYLRSRHSTHDFADRHKDWREIDICIKTKGQESGRIFGRPFITAGWPVVEVALVVALAEIALLGLIINHPISVSLWKMSSLYCAYRSLDMICWKPLVLLLKNGSLYGVKALFLTVPRIIRLTPPLEQFYPQGKVADETYDRVVLILLSSFCDLHVDSLWS